VTPALPTPNDVERVDAWLYERLHRGHRGDKVFYRRECEGARHVLECGVGWGRLLDPLSRAAKRLTGIDLHPGLLARAEELRTGLPKTRAARVSILAADLRSPPAALGPFDRILLPYNTLFCMADEAEQRGALTALRSVAAPDARLVLDTYVVEEGPPDPEDEDFEYLITVLEHDTRIDIYERNLERPDQRIDVTYLCRIFDVAGEHAVEQRIAHRYLHPRQLLALLEETGWRPVRVEGDFQGTPFGDHSGLLIVVAEPA
jgi:hypothetical protein